MESSSTAQPQVRWPRADSLLTKEACGMVRAKWSARRRWVAVVTVALPALLLATLPALSSQAAGTALVTGVDVSRWDHPNGVGIDWTKVKAAGRSFAIVKATQRTNYTNPYFTPDFTGARTAGLVIGAYHYAEPSVTTCGGVLPCDRYKSARDQAKYFVSTMRGAGISLRSTGVLPPALDLEITGGLSSGDLVAWAQTFLATVRSLSGRTPMLYTYHSFIIGPLGNTSALASYPLWYARYTTTVPTATTLPGGWRTWALWQYTSTESTNGITGAGDVNRFNGSLSTLQAFADGTASGYAPPTEPVTLAATPGVGAATLTWSAPLDDGGVPILNYRVKVDDGPAVLAPTSSFVAWGLPAGSHSFTVAAENVAGIGPTAVATATIAAYDPLSVRPSATTLTIARPVAASGASWFPVQVRLVRTDTGQALPGAVISVVSQPELSGSPTAVGVTTDTEGTATAWLRAAIDTQVTATVPASAWNSSGTAVGSVRVRPALSAVLSTTSVKRTGVVRLRGGTTPLLAGETVYRQIYTAGRWVTKSSAVLSVTGRYSFPVPTSRKGRVTMRVLLPASTHHLRVTSRQVVLTVR
ncbi:MAG TPA: hypothetical protein DHW34_01855 [Actinobacteria bacterium]|nr:hypothetical protein [Actinomycetota bacterium]